MGPLRSVGDRANLSGRHSILGGGRRRLGEPRATHVRLDVAHDVVLQNDLDLVVLDVPVRDGREPAGDAASR